MTPLKNRNNRTLLHQRRSEATVRRCFTKQVFFKILQNLQENTCVESFFNKVVGLKRLHQKYLSMAFLRNSYSKTPCTIKISMANLSQLS